MNPESRLSSAFEVPLSRVQIPTGGVVAEIVGGSFGWDDKIAVLEDINLRLVSGEFHMVSLRNVEREDATSFLELTRPIPFDFQIVGSVASGKSTLLMALLGETVQLKGSIDVQARKVSSSA